MIFLKLARIWIPARALLLSCTSKQSTPSARTSGDEFIATFRQAHDHRDLEAMSKLVCWDRVTPEMRKLTEDDFKTAFDEARGQRSSEVQSRAYPGPSVRPAFRCNPFRTINLPRIESL